jgi:hypothetical protein
MEQNNQQEIYRIDWIGKSGNLMYSTNSGSYDEAMEIHKSAPESIVSKLVKTGEQAYQWQIVPTTSGKELLNAVAMKRELTQEGKLINREGISSIGISTTPQFKKSQKARLIGMLLVTSVCAYAGTKKDLPLWLRGALFTVAAGTLYVNGRNYISNRKYSKKSK